MALSQDLWCKFKLRNSQKSLELPPFTHQLVKELKGIGKKCKLVLHRAPFENKYNWKVLLMTMASVLLECFMY